MYIQTCVYMKISLENSPHVKENSGREIRVSKKFGTHRKQEGNGRFKTNYIAANIKCKWVVSNLKKKVHASKNDPAICCV